MCACLHKIHYTLAINYTTLNHVHDGRCSCCVGVIHFRSKASCSTLLTLLTVPKTGYEVQRPSNAKTAVSAFACVSLIDVGVRRFAIIDLLCIDFLVYPDSLLDFPLIRRQYVCGTLPNCFASRYPTNKWPLCGKPTCRSLIDIDDI